MKRLYLLVGLMCMISCGILLSCKGGQNDEVVPPAITDSTVTNANPSSDNDKLNYIFKKGTEGYSCFRIPAIIKTKKGTLLAFAEARKNSCSDAGDIDLVVKRSLDSGKSWSGIIKVWDDGGNTCGNPVPVVDQKTGDVILLTSWNLGADNLDNIENGTSKDTRRVFVTHSDDDGLSWATPKEITDSVKLKTWGWYATGPCHGIQLTKGKYVGRIVVPCDYMETGTKKGGSHIIYSDDGNSWHLGGIVPSDKVNESSVAELSDGSLMINMRSSYHARVFSISKDGGLSWSAAQVAAQLPGPVCQGSILSDTYNNESTLFFSNPSNSSERINMTIKESSDNGISWNKSYQVYNGPSAYSDLVMIDAEHIGILYEAGTSSPYGGIAFKDIPVNEIK